MTKSSTKKIARAGVVGGLYVVLSMVTFSFSGGAIQFRISEGLTILPLLFPEVSIGLFVGCAITGLITGLAVYDIILGSLITLVAGILTAVVGKTIKNKWIKFVVGGAFPVLLNAFLLPVIWYYLAGGLEYLYVVQVGFLLISQSLSVYLVGAGILAGADKINQKLK